MLVRRMATVTICGAAGVDGFARLGEVLVLAGADEQARVIGLAGDDQGVVHA
jgi:hypothetical protein